MIIIIVILGNKEN